MMILNYEAEWRNNVNIITVLFIKSKFTHYCYELKIYQII